MLQRVLALVLPAGAMPGIEPMSSTPKQFDAFLRAEIQKWAKVVKESGTSID
jgi:tripartite-type tricarboxylate transporter receptor subunit TctC